MGVKACGVGVVYPISDKLPGLTRGWRAPGLGEGVPLGKLRGWRWAGRDVGSTWGSGLLGS